MTTTAQTPSVVDAPPVLAVKDLSVTFQTETGSVSAVDHVNLSLAPGEIVGIVGESGCGKSVTSMSLAGLLPRSARIDGSVRLQGQELVGAKPSALRAARGRDIAYIFQEPMTSLNPVLTVGRQVAEVLQAAWDYAARTGRRVSIEYALIRDINDQPWRAELLGRLLAGKLAHVNLIPLNPTPGSRWDASPKPVEREFARRVRAAGVPTTVRDTRGREIDGACGQLAATEVEPRQVQGPAGVRDRGRGRKVEQ